MTFLILKKIRWKNTLSYGNSWAEIDLNDSKKTLIVGKNGHGKSCINEVICFGLYNKPHRKIKKSQLVNSINKKDQLVEIEFTSGKNEVVVRRGQSPAVFEIIVNGKLLDREAGPADYQKKLETDYLRMDFKTFCRNVIIGKNNFTPFMQMDTPERRKYIETLLDLDVYAQMAAMHKENVKANIAAIAEIKNKIELQEHKIELSIAHVNAIAETKHDVIGEKKKIITETKQHLVNAKTDIETLQERRIGLENGLPDEGDLRKKRDAVKSNVAVADTTLKTITEAIDFYKHNDTCPTCRQAISEDFRCEEIKAKESKLKQVEDAKENLHDRIQNLDRQLEGLSQTLNVLRELDENIRARKKDVSQYMQTMDSAKKDISREMSKSQDQTPIVDIQAMRYQFDCLGVEYDHLLIEKQKLDYATDLLKDSGFKARDIKKYVPMINTIVNKYLHELDFFVKFELNEEFEETIKSRHRDDFTYYSFSQGEQARIDISLIFTWRQISKMKKNSSCNLLLLDEVFDGSLDGMGVEDFLRIVDSFDKDSNTIFISHQTDKLLGSFEKVIHAKKVKNFSQLEIMN